MRSQVQFTSMFSFNKKNCMKGYQVDSNSCILSQAGPMDRVLRRGVKVPGSIPTTSTIGHLYCDINVFICSCTIIKSYVINPQVKELDGSTENKSRK